MIGKTLSRYTGQTIAIIVTLLGCFGLYYGCAMLMVPLLPREPDFVKTLALSIVLPISFSLACFIFGGWLWSRATSVVFKKAVAYVFGLSLRIILLVFIILAVGANFRR